MMYSSNFAAAILANGKVLREFGDTVYLPFGSEYAIRLKNLNSTRAKVNIEIDGSSVTEGGLVINPKQTLDLERFIRNGNLTQGNRFKFIERSAKVEQYRGVQVEDGIISISFEFEMPLSPLVSTNLTYGSYTPRTKEFSPQCQLDVWNSTSNVSVPVSNLSVTAACNSVLPVNETGITVEGSLSSQTFSTTHWKGSIGGAYTMNIRLLGETDDNKVVRQPFTVKTKAKCKTCGTLNKATAKFCSECGTSLQIAA